MKTGNKFERQLKWEIGMMLSGVKDPSTPLKIISELMRSSVLQNFREGGRPEKWKPSIRAQKTGGQTLVDTGRLRGSIYAKANNNSAKVGTNVIYAAAHNFGYPPRNLPQRKFLMFQDEDLKEAKRVVEAFIMGNL
ncbi:MAG: phage virion morphogenesis protein [Clostridiales bacterium]|nr:phage virion morphogenesis protein [Clostridiales bacterium]